MTEITLSTDKLREWADAKREDLHALAQLRKQVDGYNERIRAFITLVGDSLDVSTKKWAASVASATTLTEFAEAEKVVIDTGPNLISAIEMVLIGAGTKSLSATEIRERLPLAGYKEPVGTSSSYFYTAISRLIERGIAKRLDDKTLAYNGAMLPSEVPEQLRLENAFS